jgi:hypothetical protein
MDIQQIISAMPRYGIPAIMMFDGQHGLRCQAAEAGVISINESLLPLASPQQ